MADGSHWPLPSQNTRVRRLLYLTEGMSIGTGILAILLIIFRITLLLSHGLIKGFGSFDEVVGAFSIMAIVLLIWLGQVKLTLNSRQSNYHPPEYQDWQETRQWRWVAVVAFIISGVFFGVSVFTWGWVFGAFFYGPLVLIGATLIGLGFYSFVLYKTGFNVLSPNS